MSKYEKRLSIVISDKQHEALDAMMPYGMRKAIFTVIIQDLIDAVDEQGVTFIIGGLLSRYVKLGHFLKLPIETAEKIGVEKELRNGEYNQSEPKSPPDGTSTGD